MLATSISQEGRMALQRLVVIVAVAGLLSAGCAARTSGRAGGDARAAENEPQVAAGAAVTNVWYTPGRALICGGAAVLSAVTLTVTFGQAYDTAAELMNGGCSGPWTVQPADVRAAIKDP
jgi:hypothetical protein